MSSLEPPNSVGECHTFSTSLETGNVVNADKMEAAGDGGGTKDTIDAGDGTDDATDNVTCKAGTGTNDADDAGDGVDDKSGVSLVAPFHKRLYVKLEALLRRLNENIRTGEHFKDSETSPTAEHTGVWGIRGVTTDASAKLCFYSFGLALFVFEIGETKEGAKLKPKIGLDWSNLDRLWPGRPTHIKDDNFLGEFLACHGDYVIVGECRVQKQSLGPKCVIHFPEPLSDFHMRDILS